MTRRMLSEGEQALIDQLRQEAIDDRPAYSEVLHKRIVGAVHQQQLACERSLATALRQPIAPRRDVRWMVTVAAACLAAVVAVRWQSDQPATDPAMENIMAITNTRFGDDLPRRTVTETLLPCTPVDEWSEKSVAELGGLAVSEVIGPHSAKLQADTLMVAEALLQPLPIDLDMLIPKAPASGIDLADATER